MTETALLIQQIRDPNNWTDDFFAEIEPFYMEHFNMVRSTLVSDKLWDRFDTAFSEWKMPGQVALFRTEQENNSGFGGFGNGSMDQKPQYSDGFADFVPLEHNQNLKLPPFPVECLPDEIRRYVEALAESLQVPVDMPAISVLGKIALCVQGKVEIEPKPGWREPLNLYLVIVARPSERKSAVEKATSEPVFEYMARVNEERRGAIEEYELQKKILTGKLKAIQDNLAKGTNKNKYTMQDAKDCQEELRNLKEVKPLNLVMDDVTPESLGKAMSENGERMGIFSAEGGLFGMLAGRYSDNCNIDLLLKSYTGEYYASSRITRRGEELRHPLLTLGLSVQPKVLEDIMDNDQFRGRGLLARFLYSLPESLVGKRRYRTEPVPPEVEEEYETVISTLLEMLEENTVIRLSEDAYYASEISYEWIECRLTNEFEEIEDWAGKLHGNIMRIAGLLHVVKHTFDPGGVLLEKDTMKKAIMIRNYFLKHSKAAFDIMGLSDPPEVRDAKYIISKIDAIAKTDKTDKTPANPIALSKRDVLRMCAKFKTSEKMEPGLQVLIEHGYIAVVKEETSTKGGRPSEKIVINPEYLAWKDQKNG